MHAADVSPETGVAEVWLALFFLAYLVVDLIVYSGLGSSCL